MNKKHGIIKIVLFICPFLLGVLGRSGMGQLPLLDTMYSSI